MDEFLSERFSFQSWESGLVQRRPCLADIHHHFEKPCCSVLREIDHFRVKEMSTTSFLKVDPVFCLKSETRTKWKSKCSNHKTNDGKPPFAVPKEKPRIRGKGQKCRALPERSNADQRKDLFDKIVPIYDLVEKPNGKKISNDFSLTK